jgi:adenosine/AMP kinase
MKISKLLQPWHRKDGALSLLPLWHQAQKEEKEERDQHSLIVVLLDAFPINIITTVTPQVFATS